MDIAIYVGAILVFIGVWRHFSKKFLAEDGLKWHAYMVSANLSIFISISYLIIAFEVQSWALGEYDQAEQAVNVLNRTISKKICRQLQGKSIEHLYAQLQSFKSRADYHQNGFLNEPFTTWYQQIRCMQLMRQKPELEIVAADLLLLAMEYRAQKGMANDFIDKKEQEINNFILENPESSNQTRRRKL